MGPHGCVLVLMFILFFSFLDLTVIKVPGDFVSKRLTHVITQHDIINPSKSLNNTMNLYGIFLNVKNIGSLIKVELIST